MYFNRQGSQQKNWRMIKKGKQFLFGCSLVLAIGAVANVASADTVTTEPTTTLDNTASVGSEDGTLVETSTEAATSTATSEASSTVATSTAATSEASSESAASTVATSEASSEAATSTATSEASSESAASTATEASTEVAAETTNRTAYIAYEVQYTTSTGEVVAKTANLVATETSEEVAESTLTVAAADIPAGYTLAQGQAATITQQISESQVNILSFAIVKKSEEEEIAESQLADKTVLEQVISEAIVLSDEALRQVATTQAGNTELEAAATSTQATVDQANLVLADATATQEQVDSQVETVKASTLALADEMLKVDEDGNLTVALNTTGTTISAERGTGTVANVVSNYEIRDGYVYWTHEFNNNYVNRNYYNYFFTIPSSVGAMEDLVVTQYNTDGSVRSTSNTWPDGEGAAGGIAANIGPIGNGYFDKKGLNEGQVNAVIYNNQNHILTAIDRTGFAGSDAILNNSQSEYYVLNSSRRTNNTTRWTVTYRTPIVDDSKPLDYIAGGAAQVKADNDDVVVGTYGAVLKEDLNIQNDYKLAWTQQSVSSRNDAGFAWSDDGKSIIYYYDADDTTSFNANEILKLLVANPVDSTNRTLNGDEKEKLETGIVNSTADNYYGTGDSTGADGFYYKDYLAYENGNLVQYLDVVNPTHLGGGETIPLDVDKTNTTDSITIDAKNGAGEITITSDDIPSGKQLVNSVTQRQVYARTRIVALDSTINSATDTNVVNLYFVPYTAKPNQAPTIDSVGTDGTQLKTTQDTNKYLFVFGTTEGTTETETGATTAAPVANKDNATATITMSDADGTIVSVSYDDANTPMTTLGSNLTLGTDGKLEGSFAHAAGGSYTRRVIVTDDDGATATSNAFYTYAYTDKEVDTTSIEKEEGTAVTEAEIFAKLAIATTSDAFPNTGNNVPTVPDTEYTRTVVGYRAVGSTDVTEATVDTLPTTGEYEVRVQTRNIYGQDIYNWITVSYSDTVAPETPSVEANEDGTVTVTPSQTAGDDTKTTDITYTDETGTSQTVTVTKADDGTWSVPADSGVTVDPTTGAVTIPADKVQDGSTVSATSTDEAGNTSNPATDTAKNNPDTTAPESPSVVANEDGSVTVTPSTTAGDDTKTVDITYTDENGTEQTVTVTKEDDGTWSVPADSGVTVDPTTGAVTIPADKVQDGSTVSATSTDEAGNTSNPATDTAKNNPDTTAPESPSVVANEDGSVTVTPSTTAGDDTKTVDITYTDENGTEQTVTVTKEDDGTWTVPADSGVTVDPTTGAVTIPADKVQDGSTVSATSTDEAGNTSSPATDTAKNNPDTTAPESPSVVANEDGSVTVTPSTTAGDDTKTVDITYTDENGTEQTVTVTKADDGTWTVPADSGVTVDPTTGAVTIPADKVQDGSTVSATSTDEAGNTSNPATDTAKNNPDTTAPEVPSVVANEDGSVTVTPSTTAGDDTKTVDITYTDENGTEQTVTVTKEDDGTWSVPADSGVTVDPTTGAVTIPADKVQDGSTVSATSTDEAGNTSNPATDTAKNNPDTTAPEAPVVNAPKAGDTTVTGTAEPGSTVTVTFPDGSTVTTTADEDGNYTVDVPAGVELKEGDKVTATATDEAGNVSEPTEATTTANPSDADENTPNTPAVTPVEDTNNLTDDEKAKVKEEVEKANPDLPTGTEVTVGNDGTVTITYPDGSVDTIPGTDTVTPITDTTAPEAPVVNAPKAGDTTVTGTAEPGSTVTVTFPDGSTVTTTADEDGNYTVDVPAGVELKEGDKVTATATDEAGNVSEPTEATTTANPSDADENTPNTPAVTPVEDTNNLTDDEKAKVKEEVEKANPDLPTGTEVTVGNDGTVTITYPDGSVDTISGTDTVTPITDTTAPEAPVVNTPKAGDTTVTGTAEPGSTVTVTFPDGSTVTTTADEDGNYTVDVPAGVELKEGDKVTATATDEAGNVSEPTEATTTANPSDADENTPNTPAVTPVEDTNNLTDDEKAKVKEEVEKANPDLPTGTEVTVGNDGTVTITYPDGSVDTIPGTDTVTPITDTTAPEAPVVNAPKAGDTTVTGTAEPGSTVTVTFPDGSTVTTTADEDGNYTVDVPAGVELKEGDKVTATATDEAGNVSEPTEATTTANPSDADENTPNTPAVTPVEDTNNLTDDEKAKVKEEVEKANPDLPTGTEVTVGNDGTVTITYPDGSVDTIPGTDTVTPITDTTAPEAPVVNAPKAGDTTVTGTAEPGSTVTVTFPDGSTVTTTADEDGNYTVDVPAGVELKEGDKVTATATDEAGNTSTPTETTTTANPSDADENTPNVPAVTPVEDPNNLTDEEKAKVKEEVEKANPDLPTGTEVTVGNDGTVTITYPDGSVDTISGTDTVTPITDTTAPEAPVVNAPKAGDTTVTGTAEPGSTVTVTFPDGSTVTTTADEDGNYTVDVPAGVELKEGDKVTATATDEAGNVSEPTEATTTANPSDADENTPNTPAVTPVEDTNNLTDDEKAKVKEEVEKANPDLPTGTEVTVGNDGTVTITYPDGSVDTIPGTDTVTPITDTTAPEAPVVNAPKAGDTTVTGTAEPGSTVTVTFPDGSTVTTTADEDGNYTVDVPAGVELKEGDKVTATATDEAGNVSEPTEATTTANPSDADENTPNTPAVTPVEDTNNLTDDEKAKVKEEVEKANPDLPTGTEVTVGNDGTVTITYPDGSVDTIPGTDTVTPITDTTAPEAPVVNAPKAGDTTVTGTAEPGSTVTVTFPDGSTVTTTADEDGNYTVDVPAGVELKEGDKVTATATDEAGNVSEPTEATTTANPSDADENTPNTPAVTPVEDTNNLTDDEKAKVKEEVEKANPDLPTGTEVTVGNDGTVTITYPDGSVDTIPGTDTVTPITDTTAPEAPVVNAPKAGDTTVTGTAEPGSTVTVTFPDGSTVTTTADEDGNYTVDVPAGVELKEGDKVTATATDEAGNTSTPTEVTVPDTTAPVAPEVTDDGNGNIVVTPSDDATELVITYVDQDGNTQTVVVKKGEDGKWTTDNTVVFVNPETGQVIIPGDVIKANTVVTAYTKDAAGNVSELTEADIIEVIDEEVAVQTGKKAVSATRGITIQSDASTSNQFEAKGKQLPNTGEEDTTSAVALGASMILASLGLVAKRRRKED